MGRTRSETVHYRIGEAIGCVRVHTVINASTDPALVERFRSGTLNWVQGPGDEEAERVQVPVAVHDPERRAFALVLPEAFRGRELAERATLLEKLAADPSRPVPRYVVDFDVIYGEAGLGAWLDGPLTDEVAAVPVEVVAEGEVERAAELDGRESAIVEREGRFAQWEAELEAQATRLRLREAELQRLQAAVERGPAEPGTMTLEADLRRTLLEVTRKESELREVEHLLLERQAELDRQERELRHRAASAGPEPGGGRSRSRQASESETREAERESIELAARSARSGEFSGVRLRPVSAPDAGQEPEARLQAADEPESLRLEADGALAAVTDAGRGAAEEEPAAGDALGTLDDELSPSEPPAGPPERRGPPPRRPRSTEETPLAQAVLAVAEESGGEETPPEPARPGDEWVAEDTRQGAVGVVEPVAAPMAEPEPLPDELSVWRSAVTPEPIAYVRDGLVHLAAAPSPEAAEDFVGIDPTGFIQLHRLPTHPLVVVGVASESGGASAPLISWPLDILRDGDVEILDALQRDFRVKLEVYDDDLHELTSREVHFPLEENVRIVRERALILIQQLSSDEPDFVAAVDQLRDQPEAGRAALSPPFSRTVLQDLPQASHVAAALVVVGEWSHADREDELILLRSFPASLWRQLRLKVIRRAIEVGLWMEEHLIQIALDAGFATSRKDLLRGSFAGFERQCLAGANVNLPADVEARNWRALLAEAERLGVPTDASWETLSAAAEARADAPAPEVDADADGAEPEPEPELDATPQAGHGGAEEEAEVVEADELIYDDEPAASEASPDEPAANGEPREPDLGHRARRAPVEREDGVLAELALAELAVLLTDPTERLGAALELARRHELGTLPDLFTALDAMSRSEAARLFPLLVSFEEDAEPFLIERLRSGSSLVRQGSALALGALQCTAALDPLIDLLVDEPTGVWREVARAIGDLGPRAIMSLAARIRYTSPELRDRIAAAMTAVARAHGPEGLEALASTRDTEAAAVVQSALERLEAELRERGEDDAELPPRDQPVRFFTRRFYEARTNDERELEADDILEEQDIIEESDVVEESRSDRGRQRQPEPAED
jgi:hypothetical protein